MTTLTASTLTAWLSELRAKFPVSEEWQLADAIYPFAKDYEAGLTPQQSYEKFDLFASCDAED
jgi:hypothetical protein